MKRRWGALRDGRGLARAARLAWAPLPVLATAWGPALDGRSRPVQLVALVGLWAGWAGGLLALLVPVTVALTAARLIVPAAPVTVVVAAAAGGAAQWWAPALVLALIASALVLSAEFGEHFVQGSAYGDERRLPLRPPATWLVPVMVAWAVLAGSLGTGPLLLAARSWWPGILLSAVAVTAAGLLPRRFHRLARRWLVLVPAGVVVHDHLVLAETAMIPARRVTRARLAPADTDALDLTANAAGAAVQVELEEMADLTLAPPPSRRGRSERGRAVHATALLVAPSRPGRALAAMAERNLPVG